MFLHIMVVLCTPPSISTALIACPSCVSYLHLHAASVVVKSDTGVTASVPVGQAQEPIFVHFGEGKIICKIAFCGCCCWCVCILFLHNQGTLQVLLDCKHSRLHSNLEGRIHYHLGCLCILRLLCKLFLFCSTLLVLSNIQRGYCIFLKCIQAPSHKHYSGSRIDTMLHMSYRCYSML